MTNGRRSSAPTRNEVAPRTEGTSHVRGVDLSWTSEGEGPLTFWVHGMTNDRWALENAGLYDWSPIVSSGRRLLRYDARGHGRSQGYPVPADFQWTGFAADLIALADQMSPDQPVDAIGSSTGTATLIIAALAEPERFRRLVLTAPPTAWETRAQQTLLYEQGAQLAEHDGGAAFEQLASSQPRNGLFRDLPNYPPHLCCSDALLPSVLRGGAMSNLPDQGDISALHLPTLILSWQHDTIHPVSTGERLTELIAGSELQVAGSVADLRTWGPRSGIPHHPMKSHCSTQRLRHHRHGLQQHRRSEDHSPVQIAQHQVRTQWHREEHYRPCARAQRRGRRCPPRPPSIQVPTGQ